MIWLWVALAALAIAAVFYWLVIITEGTYLGTRAVVIMYDWTARRYNRIKNLRPVYEAYFIGAPLSERLATADRPRLLDVATGTGRLPAAVLVGDERLVQVVGVDYSMPMLAEAAETLAPYGERAALVQGDGHRLMFSDKAFDAATCLEALEFMRDPRTVIREMIRVLKPGGVMLVSNRIGWESWLFPGRHCRRGRLEALLRSEGMVEIDTRLWQTYYDLIWAVKPRNGAPVESRGMDEA